MIVFVIMNIQQIQERINNKLISTPSSGEETICLISFYNCTKHSIKIYWLDYRGVAIDYSTIKPGVKYDLNSHRNHMWIFKVVDDDKPNPKPNGVMRIAAVPEEYMNLYKDNDKVNSIIEAVTTGSNSAQDVTSTHQVKFSNDKKILPTPNQRPTFIYGCLNLDHVDSHCETRRTIYLIEPKPNLKEYCILSLNKGFDKRYQIRKRICSYNIPQILLTSVSNIFACYGHWIGKYTFVKVNNNN